MSRTLDARLSKIERDIGGGTGGQRDHDLLLTIRAKLRDQVDSADASPADRDAARDRLAQLEAKVWARNYGAAEKVNIIDALAVVKANGGAFRRIVRDGDDAPDWYGLACEWGLVSTSDIVSTQPASLITRVIVAPPPRDSLPTVAHGTVQ